MLIYIALLAVLLLALMESMFRLTTSYKNIRAVHAVEQSAMLASDRIEREVRLADTIDVATSTFNVNPGVLKVNAGTSSVTFYIENERLFVKENEESGSPLTLSQVHMTSFVVRKITSTSSEAVKVEYTLQASTASSQITKNFYMTTVLRGSYK